MKKFPNEYQLLLLCSSYFNDKEKFLNFKDSHPIDWVVFLSLLKRNRVLPMVCPGKALDDMILGENLNQKVDGDAPC